MLETTIIIANPKREGMNRKIADRIIKKNEQATIIDLYADQFNPVLGVNDLLQKQEDEQILYYQETLRKTKKLYVIYPIWWGSCPAILKGFFDRILLEGFAYSRVKYGLEGKLGNIAEVILVTTSNSPKWYIRFLSGNTVKNGVGKLIFKAVGVKKIRWYHNAEPIKK
ncbi:MAG: NAD(P)H-dependent oxidoreductase [Culicoidibacterales bacterium]